MVKIWILISLFLINQVYSQQQNCVSTYGNPLIGSCSQVQACTGAALRGNCSAPQDYCCILDQSNLNEPENGLITRAIFLKLVGNTLRNVAIYKFFAESMRLASINTTYRAAAFFAQLAGETKNFTDFESSLPENDTNLSIGNNGTGDGSFYRGRGAILLRGKTNYRLARMGLTNIGYNLETNPERAAFPSIAFKVASWFWSNNAYLLKSKSRAVKGNLNELVDGTFLNFTLLTHSLTNNLFQLKIRTDLNDLVLKELNAVSLKRGQGVTCQSGNKTGVAVPRCLLDRNRPYCGCDNIDERSCPYGSDILGNCRNPSVVKCCLDEFKNDLDLVMLMDSSGSISAPDFIKEKQFVIEFVKRLEIGLNKTRVSLIRFSTGPSEITNLIQTTNLNTLINIINNIVQDFGGTATDLALKHVNEKILQEAYGMRPIQTGIPKVVVLITDGQSNDRNKTITEANKLKQRGFNLISIGVGSIDQIELTQVASTPDDFYLVDDFNKITQILNSLLYSSSSQPAQIVSESDLKTTVSRNTYKYFKYSLSQRLNKFTIELDQINGKTELFYSLTEQNPKDENDFVPINTNDTESGQNFVEYSARQLKIKSNYRENGNKKYYDIDIPQGTQFPVSVYFSVKGYEEANEFKVFVYNKVVTTQATTTTTTTTPTTSTTTTTTTTPTTSTTTTTTTTPTTSTTTTTTTTPTTSTTTTTRRCRRRS